MEKPVEKHNQHHKWHRKSELCRIYRIDKKTLNKWITFFCRDIIELDEFKRQRKLSPAVFRQLVNRFGEPNNSIKVLRKFQILNEAESSYPVIRKSIEVFPEKFQIQIDVYRKLSVFPPLVARKIIEALE